MSWSLALPSNRLSSQLSGCCGPLVRAVRAVLVVAVEGLGGQEEDRARGGHPEGEQHSAVALSTVSHFFSSPASLFTCSSSSIKHTKTSNCPFQLCSNKSLLSPSIQLRKQIYFSLSQTKKTSVFYVNFAGVKERRSSGLWRWVAPCRSAWFHCGAVHFCHL